MNLKSAIIISIWLVELVCVQSFSHLSTKTDFFRARRSIKNGSELFSLKPKSLWNDKNSLVNIASTKVDTLDDPSMTNLLRQQYELQSLVDIHQSPVADFEPVMLSNDIKADTGEPFLSPLWQARLLLLLSASLYGTNFTFVKIINENIPESVGTSLRFALASMATFPWLLQRNKSSENLEQFVQPTLPFEGSNPIIGGLEVGMWNSIGYLFQSVGLESTPASTSAFLCSLAVVTVPMLDYLAGKKMQSKQTIGALLAMIGVACLELDGLNGFHFDKNELFSLVQPFAFGMGFWRMEHYMRKFPQDAKKLTAAQLTAIFLSSLTVFIVISGGTMPDASQFNKWLANPIVIQSIAWTGLITTALTVYMETIALKTLSAAETTILFSTEPIFGSICASMVLGEKFGTAGYFGGLMILAGCLYSNIGPNIVKLVPNENGDSKDFSK